MNCMSKIIFYHTVNMCVGPPTVPNMQTEPRFDDGRTFWKRKVYSLARTAQGIGKVRKTPLVKLAMFF